ncbi:MAG TPA: hypothetical protein PKW35_18715 [Nannocystaceae bacterium]|nr:hypothetical protein [Nannocystaceae bacterium]
MRPTRPHAKPTDYFVEVDKASQGESDVAECREDNNTRTVAERSNATRSPRPGRDA